MVSTTALPPPQIVYRHSLAVRITHWVNAFCLLVLLLSGLQIFNAHPTLYFGEKSEPDRAVLSLDAVEREDGSYAGITRIGPWEFDTTGVLGLSRDAAGEPDARGFPSWITLPSYRDLATGRLWHFFFAWLFVLNGLAYLAYPFLYQPTSYCLFHAFMRPRLSLMPYFDVPRSHHRGLAVISCSTNENA